MELLRTAASDCYHSSALEELSHQPRFSNLHPLGVNYYHLNEVMRLLSAAVPDMLAKPLKPLRYGRQWLKYKCGEVWQVDHITVPQSDNSEYCVLSMVEAITSWLETCTVPHATTRNSILGLKKSLITTQ